MYAQVDNNNNDIVYFVSDGLLSFMKGSQLCSVNSGEWNEYRYMAWYWLNNEFSNQTAAVNLWRFIFV